MKTPTKFVKPLTEEQRNELKEIMKSQTSQRKRMRAHAVLLSERRYSINHIADIYQVDRDRVSEWINWWNEYEFEGLDDDHRGGRPPLLTEDERARAIELVKAEPRSIKCGLQKLAHETGKVLSQETLKEILRAAGLVWKRCRRSLKFWRDETEFRFAEAELLGLRRACAVGKSKFDLYYFDEAGFTLQPSIPYAWQPRGETLELACANSERQNVLGFMNYRGEEFHSFAFEGRVDTSLVLECFHLFSNQITRPTIVAIDNASIHTAEEFEDEIDDLRRKGIIVKYLPAYSPELNLIEILWRKIKYEWLPLSAYENFKTMTRELFEVIKGIGSKYRITFA
ncbi:MAG: IS630 family transposase [Acidobacteriota bacterium]|nr:IS630 family transposase [Acidobacteriota bacterium]